MQLGKKTPAPRGTGVACERRLKIRKLCRAGGGFTRKNNYTGGNSEISTEADAAVILQKAKHPPIAKVITAARSLAARGASGQACSTKGVRIVCWHDIEEAARGAWAQGRARPHRGQIAGGPAKHPAALASARERWRDSSGRLDRWCLVCGRGSVGLRGFLGPHARDVPHPIGQFVVRSGHLPRDHQTHRENQAGATCGVRRDFCPATDLVGRCIVRPR